MVESIFQAAALVADLVDKPIDSKHSTNKGRHFCLIHTDKSASYIIYKRQPFLSYGKSFGGDSVGESMNTEIASMLLKTKAEVNIYLVYPTGAVYSIPLDVLRKNLGNIRLTDASTEATVSFPVDELKQIRGGNTRNPEVSEKHRLEDIEDAKEEFWREN